MQEIDVIRETRQFLRRHGLNGISVHDLFTDAHPTLLSAVDLRPFQRFTLAFDGFAVHPDLVCRLADGESLVAVEAKGSSDILRGIAQAELYRRGFHMVLLACAGRPPQELLSLAQQHGVGVLAVFPNQADLLSLPPAHLPQLRHAERIRHQFAANIALVSPFYFNLPTHYLAMVPILRLWEQVYGSPWALLRDLLPFARTHYAVLPQTDSSLRSALRGAAKLGLVELQADRVRLSFTGRTVVSLLPSALEFAQVHAQILADKPGKTLAELRPQVGAVLRLLLGTDPIARLLIETLKAVDTPLSMRALVVFSAERDRVLTSAIFFRPEVIAEITDSNGQLLWHKVKNQHFRSTTFMQYKSVLKHAGIIAPHALGGSSTKTYNPDQDMWELSSNI